MNLTKFVLLTEFSKNRNRTLLVVWLIEICAGKVMYGAHVACIRVTAGCKLSIYGRQNLNVKYPAGLQTKYHL
jgi:hypothetical protein